MEKELKNNAYQFHSENGPLNKHLKPSNLPDEIPNLFANLKFPVMFLNNELVVYAISEPASKLFNGAVAVNDTVCEIKPYLNINNLEQILLDCINRDTEKEIDTKTVSGCWFKIQVNAYHNQIGEINGVLLTFFDISNIKNHDYSLKDAKLYAKSVTETIREPLLLIDCSSRVISANKQFYKIFKLTRDEVEGKIIYELGNNNEWDTDQLRRLLEQIMARTNYYSNFEAVFNFSRVGSKALLINARRIESHNDAGSTILLVMEDITYRVYVDKVCEKLIARDDQYLLEAQRWADETRTILSSIAEPVMIYDKGGTVINANNSAIESLGFDPTNMKPEKMASMLGSKYMEDTGGAISDFISLRVFQGETVRDVFYKFTNACGEEKTVISCAAPVISRGQIISAVVVWHDITERKKMEDNMKLECIEMEDKVARRTSDLLQANKKLNQEILKHRETNELLERVFSCTNFLIAYLDGNFNFIRVNRAYAQADNQSPDFFLGKNHFELFPNEENKKIFTQVLSTGEPYFAYAKPFVYANNPERGITYWDFNLHPVKNSANQVEGLVLFLVDVTRRKQIERELMKTQKELSDAKRLSDIGTLAATVAHELRNPLGVIQTAVYNITRKRTNPLIDKHLINIEKKIMESNQIINNLLIYSRIKKPQYECVSVYGLIEECVENTKNRYKNHAVSIEKRYSSLKDIEAELDPVHFKEIINNILNNSFQAINKDDDGRVEVAASVENRGTFKISIADNGIGISPQDLSRVFEPFFTKKSKGTGLGLVICKELINLHNGDIYISSEEGIGTTVESVFPIKRDFNEKK